VGDVLRIGAARPVDADCIVDALREHGAELERDGRSWIVLVPDSGEGDVLTTVLGALHACLEEHEISSVKVTVDEQTYVMQGAA
jgi:hypothetical protein